MTLFDFGFGFVVTLEELQRSSVAQGLVRADGVVGALPSQQLAVHFQQVPALRSDFVEFLVVGAMGTLDMAIEFGRTRRQHEQRQPPELTGLLEFGGEFTAAIDLHSADGEGHATQQGLQESERAARVSPRMGLQDVPTGDEIARREMVQYDAGCRTHLFGIQSYQIAGLAQPPKTRLARGPGAMAQLAALAQEHGSSRSFDQHAAAFQISEDATDHGRGKRKALVKKETTQVVLAPARVLARQRQHPLS